jgi:hypothetical protein
MLYAKRTRAKNAVRALLRGAGVVPPRQPALWTKKGLGWLRVLDLPTSSQQLRRDLLEEIEALTRQVRRACSAPPPSSVPPPIATSP